jgi:competence protein ComEA
VPDRPAGDGEDGRPEPAAQPQQSAQSGEQGDLQPAELQPAELQPAEPQPAEPPGVTTGERLRAAFGDRVPVGLRGAVVAPTRSAVAGLVLLLVLALGLALLLTWVQRPRETAAPPVQRSMPASAMVSTSPSTSPSPGVIVHVTGAVRRPGLVELPGGSRVDDAVQAAGGPTARADLSSVNLARPVVDGEQVVVLRRGQAGPPVGTPVGTASAHAGGAAPPGQPLDLNTATLEQLDGLPGVGPVLAQRIIDWRAQNGRFSAVDELTEVSGIGDRTLSELRPLVRV